MFLKYGNWTQDLNEDWGDANALATRFGVTYYGRVLAGKQARVTSKHPLTQGLWVLNLAQDNAVAFLLNGGERREETEGVEVLAQIG